jgi:hypothetical protein
MSCRPILALGAAAALAGCNTIDPVSESTDPGFGEAFRYDMAIQTIDPDPGHSEEDAKPGDSGVKGAEAAKRYRTDRVKAVEVITIDTGSGPR